VTTSATASVSTLLLVTARYTTRESSLHNYDWYNYEESYNEGVGCNNDIIDLIISN